MRWRRARRLPVGKGVVLALIAAAGWVGTTAQAQTDALFVRGSNVGIGTSTPQLPLHIVGGTDPSVIRVERAGPSRIEFRDTSGGVSWDFRTTSGDTFVITKVGTGVNELKVTSVGDLVIPGSLVASGGDGSVDPGDTFPDYVFEPDYPLMPVGELSKFVTAEKHLPQVMSSEDVKRQGGINMTDLQLQLLRKVEELTLYIIQQQRQIQSLQARLDAATPAEGDAAEGRGEK